MKVPKPLVTISNPSFAVKTFLLNNSEKMAAPFDSYSLLQPDPQYSPRRLPFESNSYSINGYNGMNATYSRNLRQEDDESAMIDPSSPASSSCSDGKPVLRGVASRKGTAVMDFLARSKSSQPRSYQRILQ